MARRMGWVLGLGGGDLRQGRFMCAVRDGGGAGGGGRTGVGAPWGFACDSGLWVGRGHLGAGEVVMLRWLCGRSAVDRCGIHWVVCADDRRGRVECFVAR